MALIGSLTSGVSTLKSFTKQIEVIGNNIANVNTTAYKGSNTSFADSFSNILQGSSPAPGNGASNTPTMEIGTGVQIASITKDFGQGTLSPTGVPSNLGISGNGFFIVKDPVNGDTFVTRAGDFRIDDSGYLVTPQGLRVQGLTGGTATYTATSVGGVLTYTQTASAPTTIGDIRIGFNVEVGAGLTNNTGGDFTDAQVNLARPAMDSYSINKYGNITATLSNGDIVSLGSVFTMNFQDPSALTSEGNNLFGSLGNAGPIGGLTLSLANNQPGTNGLGKVNAGALELSNVDLGDQFATLITAQRAFQAGSRIITVSDSILEEIINLKR